MNILPESLRLRMVISHIAAISLAVAAAGIALLVLGVSGTSLAAAAASAAAVGALGSIGASFLMVRSISDPVRSVAEGARRLARGDLDHRVRSSSMRETRELNDAFNEMAVTLRDLVHGLDGERSLLAVVMETMADGVIVLDSDNRIRLINRAAQWLLDADIHSARGSTLAEIVRDHELLELTSGSAATGRIQRAEMELLHHRRFLHAIATPISADPSRGVLLTLQDVTRLRQVQNTRREFVSNVSHELRTPLASVNAMVETLDGGAIYDTEVARDFLSRIHEDIRRMTIMVDELLELSSLESGQMPIHLAPVELSRVANKVTERFETNAASMGVKLLSLIPDDLPYLMADDGKLDQILTNLVENALKFTPAGGCVTLSARTVESRIEIEVADTGVGIAREHLPHIFERFYKVDRSRRNVGTGLGLAITRRLVQAHGGNIAVRSVEGEGSAFTFSLDRAS